MRRSRSAFVPLALAIALLFPLAGAVLPHYERAAGPARHARGACESVGVFAFSTSERFLLGESACGFDAVWFEGCENGDTGYHACATSFPDGSFGYARFLDDPSTIPPSGRLSYVRAWPDGARESVDGALATIGAFV